MSISKIPGVYFSETAEYEFGGSGAKIPVFIGKTGNSAATGYTVDGTTLLKFKNWAAVNRSIANGGIGTDTDTNPLLKVIKDFFEEAEVKTTDDIGVPYIYVVDVGDGTVKQSWIDAFATAKKATEATVEVFVGIENITEYNINAFLAGAMASIHTETTNLNLRTAFTTILNGTDNGLIALTSAQTAVFDSRLFIVEPLLFGKAVARFCCTPYYVEPGFLQYRTVRPNTFKQRTKEQELALQNAGIVFSHDEKIDTDVYTRINLSTSTAFANSSRPADALGHARFNADNLLRQIFKAIYPQVKDNEAASNIIKRQTKVDAIIDAEVEAERIIRYNSDTNEGTKLTLVESEHDPYDMELIGQIQPVNCTVAINVKAAIKNPTVKSVSS